MKTHTQALTLALCTFLAITISQANGTTVTSITAGYSHSLFATNDGNLYAMGNNIWGKLGDGTNTNRRAPVKVATNVKTTSAGFNHSLYITNDGDLYAMGNNSRGQLGLGEDFWYDQRHTYMPAYVAANVTAIAAGESHSLYVTHDGDLYATGYSTSSQLFSNFPSNGGIVPTPFQIPWNTNVTAVAAGCSHSFYVTSDGKLYAGGDNHAGQLGDGTTTKRTHVQVATDVATVVAGDWHSFYITRNGDLYAMGWNEHGQLGDGTMTDRRTPVKVASNVIAVAAGERHSLYITSGGRLYAMGSNEYGQLGDGTMTNRHTPVQVGYDAVAVAAGGGHSLYMKKNGNLYAMGWNEYGQLGDGTTTNRHSPVLIVKADVSGDNDDGEGVNNGSGNNGGSGGGAPTLPYLIALTTLVALRPKKRQ